MPVSSFQIGYKKLSTIIFEWQASDKASLLAVFITIEVISHWIWCLVVWIRQDAVHDYVNMPFLYPLWGCITVAALFFMWMIKKLSRIKNDLNKWQIILIVPYTFYIATVIVMMGYSSLFAGVSLVGGAMLGMMLVKRRYIWRVFLLQIVLIVSAVIIPYFGIHLPNLRHLTVIYPLIDNYNYLTYTEVMTIENAIAATTFKNESLNWDSISDIQSSSVFFWRSTHMYLALPKAIFIVYIFRMMLLILDNSKNEIVQYANQDDLTKLSSRRFGLNEMRNTLMKTTGSRDYSIVLLDLDLFKAINDNYGHDIGDQVLCEIAHILSSSLPNNVTVSRYGGEEFLIILADTIHSKAMHIAETLRDLIAQHVVKITNGFEFTVTASFGVYTLNHSEIQRFKNDQVSAALATEVASKRDKSPRFNAYDINQQAIAAEGLLYDDISRHLISIADKALYKAKDRGRNQVVSANDVMHVENLDKTTSKERFSV